MRFVRGSFVLLTGNIRCRIDPVYVRDLDGTPEEGARAICSFCHHETKTIWLR